jgi:pyruvate dehydrogenase E2 component (dihydrolipoamide acetyltransferase)
MVLFFCSPFFSLSLSLSRLLKIETDKAVLDFDAVEEGFLAKILVPDGTKDVKVNSPIAIIVPKKDDVAAFANYSLGDASGASAKPTAAPAPSSASATPVAPPASPAAAAATAAAPAVSAPSGGRIIASPAAKSLAKSVSVDLNAVQGSGPGGRIIMADVTSASATQKLAVASGAPAPAPAQSVPSTTTAPLGGAFEEIPVTTIRRVTASRLTEAKQKIPHYYLSVDTYIDELMRVRSELNSIEGAVKLSLNDFVLKATAKALIDVPTVNSHWYETVIRKYNEVHLGVAVNTEHGLFVPVIRNANAKGLRNINDEVRSFADKAKNRKLTPSDMEGGTFTVSNLGGFGVHSFSAVINPPQAGILAVGAAQPRLVPNDDPKALTPYTKRTVMNVTLSADHRVIDGAIGAAWLQAFKGYVENPLRLLL